MVTLRRHILVNIRVTLGVAACGHIDNIGYVETSYLHECGNEL